MERKMHSGERKERKRKVGNGWKWKKGKEKGYGR
jgi:hypothetical protein